LTSFVNAHPTVVMLCLGFLLMIGLSLIAEGFHYEIPKGYLYAAIAFSLMVETFNQVRLANEKRQMAAVPCASAPLTRSCAFWAAGRNWGTAVHSATGQSAKGRIRHALCRDREGNDRRRPAAGQSHRSIDHDPAPGDRLAGRERQQRGNPPRRCTSTATPATWSAGRLEELEGVVVARDILPDLIDGTPVDLRSRMQPALVVHDRLPVVRLIEHLKTTPTRLAIVVDGHGNIDGIVTPTDVLAAIAGDLVEERTPNPSPVRLPDGSIQFDGASPIDEVAEILELARNGGGWRLHHNRRLRALAARPYSGGQ
jgi:CBS domain-containing protein